MAMGREIYFKNARELGICDVTEMSHEGCLICVLPVTDLYENW